MVEVALLILGILGASIYLLIEISTQNVLKKRYNQMIGEVAREMGLKSKGEGSKSPNTLEGHYRDRDVKLNAKFIGNGDVYTTFEVGHRIGINSNIYLSKEDVNTKMLKAAGSKQVEVGNPDFDDKFYIKTKDPSARLILNTEVQQQLMKMKNIPEIRPDKLYIESVGNYSSKEQIREAFDELIALSDCLEHKKDGIF